MITAARAEINKISWSAVLQAITCFFWPRYWPATTAPPVARAENMLMSRIMMLSTRDTPETAASPTLEIIMESARPTVTVRSCSMISGMISFFKSLLVNNSFLFSIPYFFSPFFLSMLSTM